MSLKAVPVRVRAFIYLHWVGVVAAGLGVVGFFLSYKQVGSPAQAVTDVHREIPVLAYASILAWIVGLALMWYSRRRIDSAVTARLAESCESLLTGGCDPAPLAGGSEAIVDASIGRDT